MKSILYWYQLIKSSEWMNSNFTVVSFFAMSLFGEPLSDSWKVYLTLFSNLDSNATVRSGTKESGTDASGGRNSEMWLDVKPFHSFPDIRSFSISLNGLDWLFAAFRINKGWLPELTFERYNNKKLNSYLMYCFRVLNHKSENDISGFWSFAMFLLSNSNVFYLSSFSGVSLNWHSDLAYSDVLKCYSKYSSISSTLDPSLEYYSVFIPKSEINLSPLGVPNLHWSVYLSSVNAFLTMALSPEISSSQHGFQPFNGTLTAWNEFFEGPVKNKNIYEFDLKQFFDTVSLEDLFHLLAVKYNVAYPLLQQLLGANMCLPVGMVLTWGLNAVENVPSNISNAIEKLVRSGELLESNYANVIASSDITQWDGILHVSPLPINNNEIHSTLKLNGVAQGAPTSPLLSIMILEEIFMKNFPGKVSMYADDGYFHFDDDIIVEGNNFTDRDTGACLDLENFKQSGVSFSMDKCSWVKSDGNWLKPFNFLGLEYNGVLGELSASTRNGSELIYSMEQLVRLLSLREIVQKYGLFSKFPLHKYGSSFEELVSSTAYGLIQNSLYSGSWNLSDINQDFSMSFIKNSWMDSLSAQRQASLNIFVSTSFAIGALANAISGIRTSLKWEWLDEQYWLEWYSRNMVGNDEYHPHVPVKTYINDSSYYSPLTSVRSFHEFSPGEQVFYQYDVSSLPNRIEWETTKINVFSFNPYKFGDFAINHEVKLDPTWSKVSFPTERLKKSSSIKPNFFDSSAPVIPLIDLLWYEFKGILALLIAVVLGFMPSVISVWCFSEETVMLRDSATQYESPSDENELQVAGILVLSFVFIMQIIVPLLLFLNEPSSIDLGPAPIDLLGWDKPEPTQLISYNERFDVLYGW